MTRNSPEEEILIQAQSSDCDSRPTSEDVDEALRSARIRIQQNRRQLVSTLADLARNVTEMLAIPGAIASQVVETSSDPRPTTESDEITSKTEITAILVELGLSPRELKLLEGFSKKLVGSQQLLIKNAVSLDTISALLNSDAASRAEALTRISAGARIGVRDVKEIRSETLDARGSPRTILSRAYRSHLTSRARSLAKDTVVAFQASVLQFVSSFRRYNRFISHLPTQLDDILEMADVLGFDPSKTADMRHELAQEAAGVLDQFNSLFPNANVPVRDWSFLASNSTELLLAKSYFLLSRASTGDFADLTSEFSQFMELDGLNTLRLLGGARNITPRALAADNKAAKSSAKGTPLQPAASLDKISSGNPIRRFTAVEIFSASGASALGLEAASFHVAALCEENPEGRKSIESNRPDWGTADRLDWQTIKAAIPDSLKSKRVDVVCGAIPGRPWERKQGGAADPRNRLAEVLNVISEAKPDGVFFEISVSFLDTRHVLHHDRLIQKLSALGYNAKVYPVSGEDYGLGQTRVRAVIMGVKRSLNRPLIPPFITEPLVVSADATLKNYLNRKDAYAVDELPPISTGQSA